MSYFSHPHFWFGHSREFSPNTEEGGGTVKVSMLSSCHEEYSAAQCQVCCSARYCTMSGTVQYQVQYIVRYNTVSGTVQCQVQYSVRCSTVPGTLQCKVCCSARYSTVSGTVKCQVQCSARYITVPGTVQCQQGVSNQEFFVEPAPSLKTNFSLSPTRA